MTICLTVHWDMSVLLHLILSLAAGKGLSLFLIPVMPAASAVFQSSLMIAGSSPRRPG